MIFTANDFLLLGSQLATNSKDKTLNERQFIAFFGTTETVLSDLWDLLDKNLPRGHPKHLLWTTFWLKNYLPEDVCAILMNVCKNTFTKWIWIVVEQMAIASTSVIDFDKRYRNKPADAWCSMSIDGTDFKVQEPNPRNKKWMSYKFRGSALRYEVGISIYSGDICWVNGPHRGAKHDISIFREALKGLLDEGEMVEADQGYIGESDKIRIRDDYTNNGEKRDKQRLRNRHETANRRFKCFGILKQEYRHAITDHNWVFLAVVTIVQLGIDNGNCLFACEPISRKRESYSVDDLSFENLYLTDDSSDEE